MKLKSTTAVLTLGSRNRRTRVMRKRGTGLKYMQTFGFQRTAKYLMSLICFLICTYQLALFIKLYVKYDTSVDADVMNDPDPVLPAIVVCMNDELLNYTMCEISKEFCDTKDKPKGDDALSIITQSRYHLKLLRDCAFIHYDNSRTQVPLNICESSWVFNGYEPCSITNVNWASSIVYNNSYAAAQK